MLVFQFYIYFSVRGLHVQVITYSYSIIHAFTSALNFEASYNLQLLCYFLLYLTVSSELIFPCYSFQFPFFQSSLIKTSAKCSFSDIRSLCILKSICFIVRCFAFHNAFYFSSVSHWIWQVPS